MLDRLFDFVLGVLDLFRFWQVIDVFEMGVVLRLGHHRSTIGPGLHWILPFGIDRVLTDNVVPRTFQLMSQSLTTKDGETVAISAVVTARIEDIEKALLGVEGVDHAMTDACFGALGEAVAHSTWAELSAETFSHELTKTCRRQAKQYGVYIERIQLGDRAKATAIKLHNQQHNTY